MIPFTHGCKNRLNIYNKKFFTGSTSVSKAFGNDLQMNVQKANQIHHINTFEPHILRKALNKLPFYRFNNLQKYFPNITSVSEFLTSDKYTYNIKVELEGTLEQVKAPTNQMKLDAAIKVFDEIAKAISQEPIAFKNIKS